ncbi:uncharacterized protein [Typha latifolia]|uniref:uncharacterized protein n=1 Tax=Typha latifolia TaxID=4733 RepID=UPI003C2F942E
MDGNTWFMSSLNDTYETGETEYLHFPSVASKGRLLCLAGRSISNGTMNSYALALPHGLPRYAKLLSGLTFVSDTYYDYENLWHGLSAVVPFAAWHRRKGCAMPARWVLYHEGELRSRMGTWVSNVTAATFGQETNIERFERSDDGPSCFEEAVVFRHNEGKMTRERKVKVYDMMRCKARAYCNVRRNVEDLKNIRITLFFRVGARAFKDEEGVIKIFERECKKVKGCHVKVARPNNLTFCDQVKLMTETDILVSSHGAQLTNMFFMDKNSSIMEFYPKGWRELAGAGQYVYRWLASYSGMAHRGAWYDPNGDPCPYNVTSRCMSFYKNKLIGHDEASLTNWTITVLKEERQRKLRIINGRHLKPTSSCDCDISMQVA